MASSSSTQPQDAPPSYDEVRNNASGSAPSASGSSNTAQTEAAIDARRSLEDMVRPLPKGWIRQWDPQSHHNFFVDTLAQPPRSIWIHPYDDEQFQREHPDQVRKERERIEKQRIVQDDTDDEDDRPATGPSKGAGAGDGAGASKAQQTYAATSSSSTQPKGLKKFGRSLKDKMTGTTHEQRVQERKRREEAERRAMEQHMMIRQALIRSVQTGQPQFIGRDSAGREIFAQPPPPGFARQGPAIGYGPYQTTGGPYGMYGPYSAPMGPYRRAGAGPAVLGGLAGGMLLGGLLF